MSSRALDNPGRSLLWLCEEGEQSAPPCSGSELRWPSGVRGASPSTPFEHDDGKVAKLAAVTFTRLFSATSPALATASFFGLGLGSLAITSRWHGRATLASGRLPRTARAEPDAFAALASMSPLSRADLLELLGPSLHLRLPEAQRPDATTLAPEMGWWQAGAALAPLLEAAGVVPPPRSPRPPVSADRNATCEKASRSASTSSR
mmetsp:Transcript_82367/g.176380  ORF Transcript_82367/g.176380 Transcript_82367/m.176380 type:complete len:205 (+) Transcript_82367:196-810(+)